MKMKWTNQEQFNCNECNKELKVEEIMIHIQYNIHLNKQSDYDFFSEMTWGMCEDCCKKEYLTPQKLTDYIIDKI